MSFDRREHVRYKPTAPLSALLIWQDEMGGQKFAAQETICGFKLKDLMLKCAEIWKLPGILVQPIRGHDTARANLALANHPPQMT